MEIITFDELDSTNDYLKKNHSKYKKNTVIRALKQTNGRGRFSRVWESKEDLTFSILFNENNPHHFIAPLAINNILNKLNYNSSIKWPNDILIDNKKVSGILIEKIFCGEDNVTIVGIGINISKRDEYAYLFNHTNFDSEYILKCIIDEYCELMLLPVNILKQLYITKSSIINKDVIYNNITYKVIDINENAELVVINEECRIVINANEIDYNTMEIKK